MLQLDRGARRLWVISSPFVCTGASSFRSMPRRKRRQPYEQVSVSDREIIIAFRDCGLSYREIGSRMRRSVSTVKRICDQWVNEGRAERRAGSQRPRTNKREDTHLINGEEICPSVLVSVKIEDSEEEIAEDPLNLTSRQDVNVPACEPPQMPSNAVPAEILCNR